MSCSVSQVKLIHSSNTSHSLTKAKLFPGLSVSKRCSKKEEILHLSGTIFCCVFTGTWRMYTYTTVWLNAAFLSGFNNKM